MATISIDKLDVAIKDIFETYSDDVQEGIRNVAEKVSKDAVTELKNASTQFKGSGKYKRGWKVKNQSGMNYVSFVVHNSQYQLTHLLENGHVGKNQYGQWGYVQAFPHIKPVEETAKDKFVKGVEDVIKRGGKL